MFYLDKDAASGRMIESASVAMPFVWRYLTFSRYILDDEGDAIAQGSAFDIRRDERGVPKEPSASFFELKDYTEKCRENSLRFLYRLKISKDFNIKKSTASGALSVRDVDEIKKDPKAFSLFITPGQDNSVMIHWDLEYSKDDLDDDMQDIKGMLATACTVYVKGESDLIPCSHASNLLAPPNAKSR